MICATASVFAACNGNSDLDTKKDVVVTDTTGMYKSNASTDTGNVRSVTPAAPNTAPQTAAPTKTIIRERTIYVDRNPANTTPKVQHDVARPAPAQPPIVAPQTTPTTTSTTTTVPNAGNGNNTNTGIGSGTSGTGNSGTGTATTVPEKKKGWSNAAKDATIGGMGGAIGGAVISRNKGKGAIIGGILGAAGGYILGRKKDKKDTTR